MNCSEPIEICLMFDEAIVGPVAACLYSIENSHKDTQVIVHLFFSGFNKTTLDRLTKFCDGLRITVIFNEIDPSEFELLSSKLPPVRHATAALYRCAVGRFLPRTTKRVIYLDCDTLVFSSLRSLFQMDLGPNAIAAYPSPWKHRHLEHLGVDKDLYFNSGVLLIDLKRWREDNTEELVLSALREHSSSFQMLDQDALNLVLSDKALPLSRKYNYGFNKHFTSGEFEFPVIAHFSGRLKPWDNAVLSPLGALYVEYSARTPWPVEYVLHRKSRHKKTLLGRIKKKLKKMGLINA